MFFRFLDSSLPKSMSFTGTVTRSDSTVKIPELNTDSGIFSSGPDRFLAEAAISDFASAPNDRFYPKSNTDT